MRRGTRRGQSIADSLRIAIRGDDPTKDVASPESSPDSPDSPGSPDSTASSPSPTSTTFSTATSKKDAAPSTTQTVPPPPAATTTTSSLPPPPAATTTTNLAPPPATTMSTSQATPPATITSIPSAVTSKTASGYFNHPELSTTSSGTLVRISVISSSAPRTTASSPLPVLLNPAATTAGTGTADATDTQTLASPTSALTSSVDAEREVMSSSSSMALATSSVIAEAATASNGGLGFEEVHDRHHLEAGTVAGIAIGSSIATMLVVALIFVLVRKWNRKQGRNDASSESGGSSPGSGGVRRMLTRRFTHKSDDRIMNELMTAAYSNENPGGRNSFAERQGLDVDGGSNGYIREKLGAGIAEEDEHPILRQQQQEQQQQQQQQAKPEFKRTKRISRWLGRQNQGGDGDGDGDMMNPYSARASLASNATGLRTIDLRSMSGWGGSEYGEYYSRDSVPPLPRGAIPPREDPETERRAPLSGEELDREEREAELARAREQARFEEEIMMQGQDVRVRDSTPVAKFASPEQLKLPPPPVMRPTSVAARTEVTGRSSGTWNTWGVMQHREQPKGWKAKLGM